MRNESSYWKLDRRVPIAVLMGLFLQMAGVIVWASQLDARVGNLEQQGVGTSGLSEKFARLEERLDHMKEDIAGVKRQLDYLTDRLIK